MTTFGGGGFVLGIESSCDELACAVLASDGGHVLGDTLHSQVAMHARFGGIVPEVASRDHVRQLHSVLERTLANAEVGIEDLRGVAVTTGPGLIGSLLCGVEFARGLAFAADCPVVGIHHLEGHIAAAFLEGEPPCGPFVALLVSGGHTSLVRVEALAGKYELLGATRDDAAGEAFDKVAKFLGLGYPGGVAIDALSSEGAAARFRFPEMMSGRDNLDFSFSGLKTAAMTLGRSEGLPLEGSKLRDFCASFQRAIVENLLKKAFRAVERSKVETLVIAGGVAANRCLRAEAEARAASKGIRLVVPAPRWCTDNGAMIARAGWERLRAGERHETLVARPYWELASVDGRSRTA